MAKIKRYIFLCLGICCLMGCVQQAKEEVPDYDTINVVEDLVINEKSVPIFPKKAALTTDTAQRFALDLPKRCLVDWNNQSIVSVVPEENVEIVRLEAGDPLPELKVSDFEFKKLYVKDALDILLKDTDITVLEDIPALEKVSGLIATSSLQDAVDLITKLGHVYYSYDADFGEIHLSGRVFQQRLV